MLHEEGGRDVEAERDERKRQALERSSQVPRQRAARPTAEPRSAGVAWHCQDCGGNDDEAQHVASAARRQTAASFFALSSAELAMTESELKAMAAAAMMGFRNPSAATGTPIVL